MKIILITISIVFALSGCKINQKTQNVSSRPQIHTKVEKDGNSKVETIYLGDVPLSMTIHVDNIPVFRVYYLDGGRCVWEHDADEDGNFEDIKLWKQGGKKLFSAYRKTPDGKVTPYTPQELKDGKAEFVDYLEMHRDFIKSTEKNKTSN